MICEDKYNDEPDSSETIESMITSQINNLIPHMNRAQKRALMKKVGKHNYTDTEIINETAKKLTYIRLIEKLRELNKKKENEENENIDKDC